MIGLAMILVGAASILIGYKRWGFLMKLIVGRDRYKKRGSKMAAWYMYLIGGALILVGLLVIF